MYRLFDTLCNEVLQDSTALDQAILASWAAFMPASGDSWTPLNSPQEQWLYILSGTLPVHYNLLTAELLINGLPLTRLPSEFTRHTMYKSLFPNSVMDVGPTDEPDMRFSSKFVHHGYELHFGMKGQDMPLVAVGNNSK
jgi:hypothetical protein